MSDPPHDHASNLSRCGAGAGDRGIQELYGLGLSPDGQARRAAIASTLVAVQNICILVDVNPPK